MEDLRELWARIGELVFLGVLRLPQTRSMAATLAILASDRRNGEVKTYVADDLGTSRRVVREADDLPSFRAKVAAVEKNSTAPPTHQLVHTTPMGEGDSCGSVTFCQLMKSRRAPRARPPRRPKEPAMCSEHNCDWKGNRVNMRKPCPWCGGDVVSRGANAQRLRRVVCMECTWGGARKGTEKPCPKCGGPVVFREPADDKTDALADNEASAQHRRPAVRSGDTWGV